MFRTLNSDLCREVTYIIVSNSVDVCGWGGGGGAGVKSSYYKLVYMYIVKGHYSGTSEQGTHWAVLFCQIKR